MRAILSTDAAMNADHGLVYLVVPKDRLEDAICSASLAADAFVLLENHPASLPNYEGVDGAYFRAWRVIARAAHDHGEPVLHASRRLDTDA